MGFLQYQTVVFLSFLHPPDTEGIFEDPGGTTGLDRVSVNHFFIPFRTPYISIDIHTWHPKKRVNTFLPQLYPVVVSPPVCRELKNKAVTRRNYCFRD